MLLDPLFNFAPEFPLLFDVRLYRGEGFRYSLQSSTNGVSFRVKERLHLARDDGKTITYTHGYRTESPMKVYSNGIHWLPTTGTLTITPTDR